MYSLDRYKELLQLMLEEGYAFGSFTDSPEDRNGKVVYLRHDVDYSLNMAVELAKVNHKMGVRATFFFRLRSQIYNLLSYYALERVGDIRGRLGQYIGLHYSLPPQITELQLLPQLIISDFELLKRHLPEVQPVFSFHDPSLTPAAKDYLFNLDVPGLVNTYGRKFTRESAYFSDSNLRYSVSDFKEIIKAKHRKIQFLFHPFPWVAEGKDMLEVIARPWKAVIRERESEIIANRIYGKQFPQGIPEEVLEEFKERILKKGAD